MALKIGVFLGQAIGAQKDNFAAHKKIISAGFNFYISASSSGRLKIINFDQKIVNFIRLKTRPIFIILSPFFPCRYFYIILIPSFLKNSPRNYKKSPRPQKEPRRHFRPDEKSAREIFQGLRKHWRVFILRRKFLFFPNSDQSKLTGKRPKTVKNTRKND